MTGPKVPAAPVRIHVQGLLDQGMRPVAIYRAAKTTSATLSALIYGQFQPGRPPQRMIGAEVAARLLAVDFQASPSKQAPALCTPSGFEAVGYHVGRCLDCGQVAPVQTRSGTEVMFSHPRAQDAVQGLPTAAGSHPDCGHTRGVQRHRRAGADLCGPCRNVQRGYDAGYKAAMTRAARDARNAVPADLVNDVVAFCRALVLQPWPPGRPVPRSRALARKVVQMADAELAVDDETQAA